MTARTIPANRTRNAGRLALDLGMFATLLLLLEPHATGLHIFNDEQVEGAEEHTANAQH